MNNKINCTIKKITVCLFLGLILSPITVFAATANQYFDKGVSAAQRQQHQAALDAFLKAKQAGLDSPELNYNLGVVYYQLGKYAKATETFQLLVGDDTYAAVAFYNLGLIALKQGNEPAAKDWFLKAYSNAADNNVKTLSERALQRLDVEPPAKPALLTGWGGFVSLDAGYDDNVALIDEDISQAQDVADYHLELFASTARMLWGSDANGIHVDANIDILKQRKEQDYDYAQWHLALAHRGVFSRWDTRVRAGIDRTRFGNVDFQQLMGLELRGQRDISVSTGIELRYKYVGIKDRSPEDVYEYLAGKRQQLRLRLLDSRRNISFKYAYELQWNDRNDYRDASFDSVNNITTITTRSYSPMRHSIQVSADVPWGKLFTLSFDAQYRYSYYSDPDTLIIVDETDGAITQSYSLNRKDHRYKTNLGFAYHFSPSMEFFFDYGFTKNDSNRDGSDYDRHLVRVGVTWFY
ncbi:tetratricopeptide repeat protein [Kaarinaea lacus]